MDTKRVYLDTQKIQKSNRITLSKSVITNFGVKAHDSVDIFFDTEKKALVIQKSDSQKGKRK